MGKNTYFRKYFTDSEINALILKIDGFKSLFDNRIFNSEKKWRSNISRHLDHDSCNRFYFKLENQKSPVLCLHCKTQLGIDSFSYTGYNKGFSKYCPCCTKKEIWKFSENYDPIILKNRGYKISKRKLEFYKTTEGKQVAVKNGRKISTALKKFHTTEAGERSRKKSAEYNSQLLRSRILSGEFTPKSNNRNTHWDSRFNNKTYRSSWEALYQYYNPNAEYEKLRITYEYKDKNYIYIVDFIEYDKKIVTEVKPKELLNDPKTKAKLNALTNWANINHYTINIFNMDNILSLSEPDYSQFDIKTQQRLKAIYAKIKN